MFGAGTERLCKGVTNVTVLPTSIADVESAEHKPESGESVIRGALSLEPETRGVVSVEPEARKTVLVESTVHEDMYAVSAQREAV